MKKHTILLFAILSLFSFVYSDEIAIPDLETRITNTGNIIPESALPPLKNPEPSALPVVPEPSPVLPVSVITPAPESENSTPVEAEETDTPMFTGYLDLGGGLPSTFDSSFSLLKKKARLPGFVADGAHISSSLNHKTGLGFRIFDESERPWLVSLSLADRVDDFQQKNRAESLTHREAKWNADLGALPFFSPLFSLSFAFEGKAFSSTSEFVSDYTGYFLSPKTALTYESSSFFVELSGRYGYETVAKNGEFQNGTAALNLRYTLWDVCFEAESSACIDSLDGFFFPFNVGISRNSPDSLFSRIILSGGLAPVRSSPWDLTVEEPFTRLAGLSVFGADWNGLLGFTVSPFTSQSFFSNLSFSSDLFFRTTAFDRGLRVLTNEIDNDGLLPIIRVNRNSLVTKAAAVWTGSNLDLGANYSGEWLDRLYRTSVQTLGTSVLFHDKKTDHFWEAGLTSLFSLDCATIPVLNIKATVRPISMFSISLALNDGISLLSGKDRVRNGVYTATRGDILLSARIDY